MTDPVEFFEKAHGVTLMPWQKKFARALIDAKPEERAMVAGGRSAGKSTVRRVVAEARERQEKENAK